MKAAVISLLMASTLLSCNQKMKRNQESFKTNPGKIEPHCH